MERFGWLGSRQAETALAGRVAGTYTAQMGGAPAVFRLWFSPEGHLQGSLSAEGQELEVRGGVAGRGSAIYGFLIEVGGAPVAMFRARPGLHGLTLQLEVPDFDEAMDLLSPERIVLSKGGNFPGKAGGLG
ncbi:MAG: hypothetical protein SFU83_12240 [Meiothermus sp.]|nr:hypothetical protein [Meiothermus sp.]